MSKFVMHIFVSPCGTLYYLGEHYLVTGGAVMHKYVNAKLDRMMIVIKKREGNQELKPELN